MSYTHTYRKPAELAAAIADVLGPIPGDRHVRDLNAAFEAYPTPSVKDTDPNLYRYVQNLLTLKFQLSRASSYWYVVKRNELAELACECWHQLSDEIEQAADWGEDAIWPDEWR